MRKLKKIDLGDLDFSQVKKTHKVGRKIEI